MLNKILNILQKNEFKQTFITLLLRIIGVLTLFIFTIFFNRNFSADVVGDYEFTRMFLLVTGGICLFGTDLSILFFSGKLKSKNQFYLIKPLYYKIIFLHFLFSLLLIGGYFLIFSEDFINSFFGKENSYTIVTYSILFLVFNLWTLFNTEVLRALDKIVISELFRNTFKFFPIFIGAFLLYQADYQEEIIFYYILGFVALAVITFLFVLFYFREIKSKDSEKNSALITFKEILSYSVPMGISSLIIYLLSTIDIVFIRNYYSSADVAYYSLGIKLMTILGMVILSINVNISPKVSELYQLKEFEHLKTILRKSSWVIFGLNMIVGVIILMFADYILPIFGEEYINSKSVLIIVVLGQMMISAFGSVSVYLNMTGRPSIFRRIMTVALVINLVSNYLLIPRYGILGGALSYVITALFWNLIASLYILKKDNIKIFIH